MSNYPFKDPVDRQVMDIDGLRGILAAFEDTWAKRHGERITSAQFYDRYLAGDLDTMFFMAWSTYYEIYRDMSRSTSADGVVDRLAAVG